MRHGLTLLVGAMAADAMLGENRFRLFKPCVKQAGETRTVALVLVEFVDLLPFRTGEGESVHIFFRQ